MFAWLFVAVVVLVIFGELIFPVLSDRHRDERISQARMDTGNLRIALDAYRNEYGKWPDFTGDGLFLDEKRQARLLRLLQGKDEANNPRNIVFFEGRTATQSPGAHGQFRGGFSPATGAYLDPQGNPYRIAIDTDGDEQIANPYPDDSSPLRTHIIVWSLGKDGKQGSPTNPHTFKGSDDVTSWR